MISNYSAKLPRMIDSLQVNGRFANRVFPEGGNRVVVPWYQRDSTWYNIVQMWWNLVAKVGIPVPSLYESAPIKISSMDDFRIPRTNF